MSNPLSVRIGFTGPKADHVHVNVLSRELPDAQDFYDANWLMADIGVRAGGFSGCTRQALLRTEDFADLLSQLESLYDSLAGTAEFTSLEPWLRFKVVGDGLGHFVAEGKAVHELGVGNVLSFRIEFDQTELPRIIAELRDIVQKFPVRGRP